MDLDNLMIEFTKVWEVLKTPLVKLNEVQVSFVTIAFAIFTVIFSFFLSKKFAQITKAFLRKKGADSGVADSIGQFLKIIIIILGIVSSLGILGFSLESLAAVSAVLMVGIGFGLQNIAQNFISGIIILVERPIKVGDIVQVGSTTGRVLDIRVRSTIVQTRDDISIIVPNSKLIAEDVINESFTGSNIRLHISVGVAYGSDTELIKNTLLEAANNHPEVMQSIAPDVIFSNFGDSSLDFELRVWTSQIWEQRRVRSEIRFEISKLFKKYNIQIPFPQQDVYIKQIPNS